MIPIIEIDAGRAPADLLRVLAAHDDWDAQGWCTGCRNEGVRLRYPCPAKVHLERAVDAVAARLAHAA